MSNTQRINRNLQQTVDGIKTGKTQEVTTSLAIIAQCQIDINYTLALMLDEIKDKKAQAIPIDKVKQAREEIKNLKEYGAKFDDGFEIHANKADVLEIIDNLIAESEG